MKPIILLTIFLAVSAWGQTKDSTLSVGVGFFSPSDTGHIEFGTSQHPWFATIHNNWKTLKFDSNHTYFFQFAPKFIVIRGDTIYRREKTK